ncbi:MAG: hypothetical protein WCL38_04065, partial [Actinomycetota bacterium]
MAGEYEIPVWTASQAGRSALEEDIIEADKIASSYGKVKVADFLNDQPRDVIGPGGPKDDGFSFSHRSEQTA